ncbi:MAG: C4-dicarboxylate transporter DcuC [Gemmataceae bacterium]|nr:C4-dicarboxylate transporter DcuC [Gemmataceae bacterium]
MSAIQWLSLAVVGLAVAAIVRGREVRLVLILAAMTLGTLGGDPAAIVREFLSTFSSEKFVVPICCAMGFAYILRHTGCDAHLVRLLMKPVRRVRFLLIPGVLLVAFTVNIPVISQTSVAVCVGPVVIPLFKAAGYGPMTIAACLALGASIGGELLNPGAPELLTVRGKTGVETMILARQYIPPLLIPYVLVAGLVFWFQSVRENRTATATEPEPAAGGERINVLKAAVPLVPLALLFLTGPPLNLLAIPQDWLAKTPESFGSRLIGAAMLVGVLCALLVSPGHAKDGAKQFFEGAGYGFTNVISLIVTGACFAEGMKLCGLAAALGHAIAGSPELMLPLAAVVPMLFAFVSGSGIASTKGLYEFFHDPAVALGHDPNAVGAVVSMGAAAGRTMSPVAAVVLMSGTLTGAKPFDIVKRVAPPLMAGLAASVALRMLGAV